MKVLVTGAEGFIGQHVVKKLRKAKLKVVPVDIRQDAYADTRVADVNFSLVSLFSEEQPDVVIHLAGPVAEAVRKEPYQAYMLQMQGTLRVLEAARQMLNKPLVILASSFYVYDGINPKLVVNEHTALTIHNIEGFGQAKLMAEGLLVEYGRKYDIDWLILRLGSAYGAGERSSNVVRDFIQTGRAGETIEVWGAGDRVNQYTLVDDLADGIVLAVEQKVTSMVFNLIDPKATSTKQLANIMRAEFQFDVLFFPEKPEGKSMPYMSGDKAVAKLGWEPTPLKDGLSKTYKAMG